MSIQSASANMGIPTPESISSPKASCTCCSNPRTRGQFMRNHLKTHVLVADGDDCRICWGEYGTVDAKSGRPDVPCAIVDIEGCSHIMGWACITDNVLSGNNSCPFCRIEWFTEADFSFCLMLDEGSLDNYPSHMDEVSEEIANMCKTDYASARALIYGEEEYESLTDEHQIFEVANQIRHIHSLGHAVETIHIQNLIALRQEACTDPADERLCNPYDGVQEPYLYKDLFTFRNWHASTEVIRDTVWAALCSPTGQRLRDLYTGAIKSARHEYKMENGMIEVEAGSLSELTINYWDTHGHAQQPSAKWAKIGEAVLVSVEEQWMAWYGEEYVCTFSRFMLHVLHEWIMSEPTRMSERDSDSDVSRNSGGEYHCHDAV